jgi:CRP-like cAMP-binding protein
MRIFKRTYSPRERSTFRFLRKSALFRQLTDDELADFLPILHLRDYRQSEVIFFRGDPSQALYIVREGRVSLTLDVGERFEELQVLSPSNFFGEGALVEGRRRPYNAISLSDATRLYVIPALNLMEIFSHSVVVKAKMMTALAEHFSQQQDSLFKTYQSTFGFFDLSEVFNR